MKFFDGYGLPLSTYKNPKLQAWLAQWKEMVSSDLTLQAIDSQTCGHYALMDSLETGNFGENGDCSEIGNFGKIARNACNGENGKKVPASGNFNWMQKVAPWRLAILAKSRMWQNIQIGCQKWPLQSR